MHVWIHILIRHKQLFKGKWNKDEETMQPRGKREHVKARHRMCVYMRYPPIFSLWVNCCYEPVTQVLSELSRLWITMYWLMVWIDKRSVENLPTPVIGLKVVQVSWIDRKMNGLVDCWMDTLNCMNSYPLALHIKKNICIIFHGLSNHLFSSQQ